MPSIFVVLTLLALSRSVVGQAGEGEITIIPTQPSSSSVGLSEALPFAQPIPSTRQPVQEPPKEPAAVINVRNAGGRSAAALNRFTFAGNVLEGTGGGAASWIVFFYAGWNEKCMRLMPSYEALGANWEETLERASSGGLVGGVGALLSPTVRFAKVDCATEKELCNSQGIFEFPTAVHYRRGASAQVERWSAGSKLGLAPWIRAQLRPKPSRSARHLPSSPVLEPTVPCGNGVAALPGALPSGLPLDDIGWNTAALVVLGALLLCRGGGVEVQPWHVAELVPAFRRASRVMSRVLEFRSHLGLGSEAAAVAI